MSTPTEKLADALRKAAEAHHEYERTLGHPDGDWAGWYADYIVKQKLLEA